MLNWYKIKRPFDTFTSLDMGRFVLLEGDARHAELERQGYLENVGPDVAPQFRETVAKKVRRGKQDQDRSAEKPPVGEVPGDELRGTDVSAD